MVIIDDRSRTSCNLPAYKADGANILTIEGVAQGQHLSPIQEAFIESGAIQCGYCTPGMVIEANVSLDHNP